MKRPRNQGAVIKELEAFALRAVDQVRDHGAKTISGLWEEAKTQIRQSILHEYYRDFPNVENRWSLGLARAKGTFLRIERDIAIVLNRFHAESIDLAAKSFTRVYVTASLRHGWIIDQVTPPSYDVAIPLKHQTREAAVAVYTGTGTETVWKDRWSAWMGAYQSALNNNLRMSVLSESSPNDAANEVDQTKPGTPAYDVGVALDRIYNYQALAAYSEALADLQDANQDLGLVEIWQTRDNQRVCDECDANRGMTAAEASNEIPAHPNCECYWRLVPASWADLLRSGDASEQDLAKILDARQEVPNSMILKDDDGNLVAHAIVSFERWSAGIPTVVGMER